MGSHIYCTGNVSGWFKKRLKQSGMGLEEVCAKANVDINDLNDFLENRYGLESVYNIGPHDLNKLANIIEPEPDYSRSDVTIKSEESAESDQWVKCMPIWLHPYYYTYRGGKYRKIYSTLAEYAYSQILDIPECPDWIYRVDQFIRVERKRPYYERQDFEAQRRKALKRDNGECVICNTPSNTVDHIVPIMDGGTHNLDNLQVLCKECHRIKTREELGYS